MFFVVVREDHFSMELRRRIMSKNKKNKYLVKILMSKKKRRQKYDMKKPEEKDE